MSDARRRYWWRVRFASKNITKKCLSTLLCLCLFGCVYKDRQAIACAGKSTVKVTGDKRILSESDIQNIIKAVQASPRINHNIISIKVITGMEVEVTTGIVRGLLHGGGDIVIVRKNGDEWKLQDDMFSAGWYS